MLKKTEIRPLDDLSTDTDSSWRDIDEEEVARLEKLIEDGEYGSTALSQSAQIACDDVGTAFKCQDGRDRLANGKRMTTALKNKQKERTRILAKHQNAPAVDFGADSGSVPDWCTQAVLVSIFENGCLGGLRHMFACLLICMSEHHWLCYQG